VTDRRETILTALFTALEGVNTTAAPVPLVERNPVNDVAAASDQTRPAIRLYDGDEIPGAAAPRPARRKSPVFCRMQPEIVGFVQDADNGTEINALLARIRAAVWNNDAFLAVLGENDTVAQDSLRVGFNQSESEGGEGAFSLTLAIDYVFNPASP
jgi:hypothetical protein